jgi:hypothetical protein
LFSAIVSFGKVSPDQKEKVEQNGLSIYSWTEFVLKVRFSLPQKTVLLSVTADIANVPFLIWGLKVNVVPCPKEEGSTKKKSFLKREGAQLGLGFLK